MTKGSFYLGQLFTGAILLFSSHQVQGQVIEKVNPSVVKIVAQVNGKTKVGTGLVIRVAPKSAYIVTASHVVEGDPSPKVEFFTRRNHFSPARIIGIEGGDDRGLAGLLVEGQVPSGIRPMPLNHQLDVQPGDAVTLVGFPRMAGVPWAVTKGEAVGRKGRDLVFSSPVDEGSSGGPLLKDGQVIGIVTEVGTPFAYSVPALIAQYALESWGVRFGVHLRSEPAMVLAQSVVHMIQEHRFHHPADFSTNGFSGFVMGSFEHEFHVKKTEGVSVVIDYSTSLMWQQAGSDTDLDYVEAATYIQSLNQHAHGGFSDWRLPTIEELASLIEPIGANNNVFIDVRFSPIQRYCWTYDRKQKAPFEFPWVVNFDQGGIFSDQARSKYFVKAVRSMSPDPFHHGSANPFH